MNRAHRARHRWRLRNLQEALLRERGESRSRFIGRVLRLAVHARRDAEVTRRLDALFADKSVREEQRREAQELAQVGIDWDSERW